MAISLTINDSKCISCGRCLRVCPSMVFSQGKKNESVEVESPENCIICGHCAAVCPTKAIEHAEFPPEKVHEIDRSKLPSPEQVMLLIKSRRSNRTMTKKPVSSELIDQIIEAAHRAPTASNMQNVSFTVVTEPHKVREIAAMTIDTFMGIVRKLQRPIIKPIAKVFFPEAPRMIPRFLKLKEEFDKGNDPILRGGTVVIFTHTPDQSRFGCEDSNLAYQNASLMAESLGLSQIYTGFVCTAIKMDKKQRIKKMLGIKGKIHAGMAIGVPEFLYPRYIDKKDLKVSKL